MSELYPGQVDKVEGELRQREIIQQADRELLDNTTDPQERQTLLRRIAGREGDLAHRRRFLSKLRGEDSEGVRDKVIRLRLTDDEYGQLSAAAEEAGQTLSQYAREKLDL